MFFELERQEKIAERVRSLVLAISQIDPMTLTRPDLTMNFRENQRLFEAIRDYFQSLTEFDWLVVPQTQELAQLQGLAERVLGELGKVKAFNPITSDGAYSERQNIMEALDRAWSDFSNVAYKFIPHQLTRAAGLQGVSKRVEDAEAAMRDALNKVVEYSNQAKQVLEDVNRAAATVGVAQQALHFGENAKRYKRRAVRWRWAAGLSVLLTGSAVYLLFWSDPASIPVSVGTSKTNNLPNLAATNSPAFDVRTLPGATTLIQRLSGRVVIISILISMVIFTIRNYSACCHNQILNEHRALSLSTFETFVAGTSDQKTKDAILLQAAQAAFSIQPSGYLKADSEQVNPVTNIFPSKES